MVLYIIKINDIIYNNNILNKIQLIGEIKIQKSLHHQNIVRFYDVFEDSENVYMIIEICRNMVCFFFNNYNYRKLLMNDLKY